MKGQSSEMLSNLSKIAQQVGRGPETLPHADSRANSRGHDLSFRVEMSLKCLTANPPLGIRPGRDHGLGKGSDFLGVS